MTTYSKETALYDTGKIAGDITGAGQTASKYITAVDSNGIKVHAENNPDLNYTKINAEGMELYKDNSSIAKFGSTARIGTTNGARLEIKNNILANYSENGVLGFEVDSSGDEETITKTYSVNGTKGIHTYTIVLPDSNITSGASMWVNVYLSNGETYLIKDFKYGTRATKRDTNSVITVTYNGAREFTVVNSATNYKVEQIDVRYRYRTVPTTVSIPYNLILQDESLTEFIFNPYVNMNVQQSSGVLTSYSNRVDVSYGSNRNAGYIRIGQLCYIHVDVDVLTTLSTNNTWAIIENFPNPVYEGTSFNAYFEDVSVTSGATRKSIGAYMNSNSQNKGRLCIITAGTALAANDVIHIDGWYISNDNSL